MGWDAFGLPAEQYAVKTGRHPRQTTEANITTFKRQIQSLGFSYDWSRELATTDPDYFKWTQWIFLKLYNSWFNPETNKAEPIETLKYPAELSGRDALPRVQANQQVGPTKFMRDEPLPRGFTNQIRFRADDFHEPQDCFRQGRLVAALQQRQQFVANAIARLIE